MSPWSLGPIAEDSPQDPVRRTPRNKAHVDVVGATRHMKDAGVVLFLQDGLYGSDDVGAAGGFSEHLHQPPTKGHRTSTPVVGPRDSLLSRNLLPLSVHA